MHLKEQTYGGDMHFKEQTYRGDGGDICMKEQTYRETYKWWSTQRVESRRRHGGDIHTKGANT